MRLMLAVMVALALMPACIMLVCTTMDVADPGCIPHSLSSTDPSSGGVAGFGGSLQSLLLAFVALAAILAVRFNAVAAITSNSLSDGRSGPIPPPRRGSTPLLI